MTDDYKTHWKKTFSGLLQLTGRQGIPQLLEYLDKNGFYESPASIKWHCNYPGGLCQHSHNVYQNLLELNQVAMLNLEASTTTISALLHDLCKMGAYVKNEKGYHWNQDHPKGHGTLSVSRITQFITLYPIEEAMIKFHMGPWNTVQAAGTEKGDYAVLEMIEAWKKWPAVKYVYFADEISTSQEGKM